MLQTLLLVEEPKTDVVVVPAPLLVANAWEKPINIANAITKQENKEEHRDQVKDKDSTVNPQPREMATSNNGNGSVGSREPSGFSASTQRFGATGPSNRGKVPESCRGGFKTKGNNPTANVSVKQKDIAKVETVLVEAPCPPPGANPWKIRAQQIGEKQSDMKGTNDKKPGEKMEQKLLKPAEKSDTIEQGTNKPKRRPPSKKQANNGVQAKSGELFLSLNTVNRNANLLFPTI